MAASNRVRLSNKDMFGMQKQDSEHKTSKTPSTTSSTGWTAKDKYEKHREAVENQLKQPKKPTPPSPDSSSNHNSNNSNKPRPHTFVAGTQEGYSDSKSSSGSSSSEESDNEAARMRTASELEDGDSAKQVHEKPAESPEKEDSEAEEESTRMKLDSAMFAAFRVDDEALELAGYKAEHEELRDAHAVLVPGHLARLLLVTERTLVEWLVLTYYAAEQVILFKGNNHDTIYSWARWMRLGRGLCALAQIKGILPVLLLYAEEARQAVDKLLILAEETGVRFDGLVMGLLEHIAQVAPEAIELDMDGARETTGWTSIKCGKVVMRIDSASETEPTEPRKEPSEKGAVEATDFSWSKALGCGRGGLDDVDIGDKGKAGRKTWRSVDPTRGPRALQKMRKAQRTLHARASLASIWRCCTLARRSTSTGTTSRRSTTMRSRIRKQSTP